jgi:hypothetical protein
VVLVASPDMRLPVDRRVLEVAEHQPPVRDLPFIQLSDVGQLTDRHDRLATEDIRIAHQARPGTTDLAAVALEAERVVRVGAHFPTISKSGLPLLARRAQLLETL